ncbi:MAG: hypothetical protein AMS15_06190 [Planctomycetes bacterium DG_23]|nr:MAG: hypothetical protein AMS15_06190 [Planctomycetes bacterium DG_23]
MIQSPIFVEKKAAGQFKLSVRWPYGPLTGWEPEKLYTGDNCWHIVTAPQVGLLSSCSVATAAGGGRASARPGWRRIANFRR